MNDPRKVLSTLKELLYESATAETLHEKASLFAAARVLIADFEAELKKNGLEKRGSEALLRLRESFGGILGTEPVNPSSNLTYGAMGLSTLKDLAGEFKD